MRRAVIAPRWWKVLRDITGRPARSLVAIAAMSAGVFEIGVLAYKYAVLQPVLTTMYSGTRPASATLITDHVSDALIDSVRRVPGIADAEARPMVVARLRVGEDDWVPVAMNVVRDFDRQRLDTFVPEAGAWPPGAGDILLERSALSVAGVTIGDSVAVRTPGGGEHRLRVAGTVHAAGMPPAWMEHSVPAFVSWDSRVRGADQGESAQIRIVVADHPLDEGYIRETADSVKAMLERQGHSVARINVPKPGRHPHADQMDAFLYLLAAFAILCFVLSAALVASMIHALLTEQVRQVGIMKAIGATSWQIAGLYLGQVSILAAASLCVGIPLGVAVGRGYARFSAEILNANITHAPFPVWVIGVECAIGILVPLLFALWPVYRASRITVHEALNDAPGTRPFGSAGVERWLTRIRWIPRPLMLSLRTTLLRRGRLALTVGTLALGGAVFMSAMNVSGAWDQMVRKDFDRRHYDLTVFLARPTPIAELTSALATQPDVVHAEFWPDASPYLISASGVAGGTVALLGPEPSSPLLTLPLSDGRWLRPGDTHVAVINRAMLDRNSTLHVGGNVQLRHKGRTVSLPIVGMVTELAPMPIVYAPAAAVLGITGQEPGLARTIRIVTRGHDDAAQRAAARSIERELQQRQIEVGAMQRMLDVRKSILDHLVIIMAILTLASLSVVFVGGIALASTLMLNVVQRTREFGVLSAIGATPTTIATHVWFEGLAIGLLSWGLALVLSAPISYGLEVACGNIFFKAPLDFYMSPMAAALWLALVVVLASLSSASPAWRAARLTVREALSHT